MDLKNNFQKKNQANNTWFWSAFEIPIYCLLNKTYDGSFFLNVRWNVLGIHTRILQNDFFQKNIYE